MKTDDYFDQREEIVGQTPPWTEEEIECAKIAESIFFANECTKGTKEYCFVHHLYHWS